jgi:hypothetical protein
MGTVLVVLLALAAVAFVAYPLVRGMRQRPIPSVPDLETQMAYADAEEIELDFRTGKLDEAEYEALTRRTAAATDDELERRIQAMRKTRRRAAKPAAGQASQRRWSAPTAAPPTTQATSSASSAASRCKGAVRTTEAQRTQRVWRCPPRGLSCNGGGTGAMHFGSRGAPTCAPSNLSYVKEGMT